MLGGQAIFGESPTDNVGAVTRGLLGDPIVVVLGPWAVSSFAYGIESSEHRDADATGVMTA